MPFTIKKNKLKQQHQDDTKELIEYEKKNQQREEIPKVHGTPNSSKD